MHLGIFSRRLDFRAWPLVCGLFATLLVLGAASSLAAPINHGNFGPDYPPGVLMYLDVTESSGTDPVPPARYGVPTIAGDTLDFDPTEFVAFSTGGGADITDGQLNFTLMSLPLTGVTSLDIDEEGDYTLVGSGTAATQVVAGVIAFVDILEVDGVLLPTPVSFSVSASFADNLAGGTEIVSPWSIGITIDFASILTGELIAFEWGVSKAEIAINNQLIAISESGSVAFIAKKDFTISPTVIIDPEFVIPEPSSIGMMFLAIAGFGAAFRRRLWRVRG